MNDKSRVSRVAATTMQSHEITPGTVSKEVAPTTMVENKMPSIAGWPSPRGVEAS